MRTSQQIDFKANSKLQAFSKKIYEELNVIYSSTYCSTEIERKESIQILSEYFKLSKDAEDIKKRVKNLKDKIQQLKDKAEFKQKLCVLIQDKYWERTFVPLIQHTPYDPKLNL